MCGIGSSNRNIIYKLRELTYYNLCIVIFFNCSVIYDSIKVCRTEVHKVTIQLYRLSLELPIAVFGSKKIISLLCEEIYNKS